MTTPSPISGYPCTRRRIRRAVTAAVAAVVIVSAPVVGPVSASPAVPVSTPGNPYATSSNPEIAERSTRALDLLDHYLETDTPTSYTGYLRLLDEIARLSAADLGLDGDEMSSAWFDTPRTKQIALLAALTQLGVPYKRMASIEGVGFDCSGLVSYAYARAGVELPRSSRQQIQVGQRVTLDEAEAGDFVYYPGHIMMYLGVSNAIVHSPNTGNLVEIRFVAPRRTGSVIVADPIPEI